MLVCMHPGIILLVFSVIFVSELPDKSLFATLFLSTRYPALFVWLGAASAFLVHVIIAVTIGHFLTLLPHTVLESIIAAIFLLGAIIVLFGKHGLDDGMKAKHLNSHEAHKPWLVFLTAFGVVFIGEWGDITQIVTANYAAHFHDTINVAIGSTLALWTVSALAVIVGKRALSLVPPKVLQRITALVLFGFAVATLGALL